MKKLLVFSLLFISLLGKAQIILDVHGETHTYSAVAGLGYDVPRTSLTTFSFRNNIINDSDPSGHMLSAGDETHTAYDNNLAGEVITGNKFVYTGADQAGYILHGIFTGHEINASIMYNYCDKVPMSIVRKSTVTMSNTSGGVAYNVIHLPSATGVVVKGMNNVAIYNNTFYSTEVMYQSSDALPGTWRGLVDVYSNTDITPNVPSTGTIIKNNIFYTTHQIYNIYIYDAACLAGFVSDYNIFYCTAGEPWFNYLGTKKTFTEWKALGFDQHSVVVNPNFASTTTLVPTARLDYGINLGSTWQTGLATNATWTLDVTPATAVQNGNWQVGAYVFAAAPSNSFYVATNGSDANPGTITQPWATWQYGVSHMTAGSILYIRGGTYTPSPTSGGGYYNGVYINRSGTSSAIYSVMAYPGETPILDCRNVIGNAERYGVFLDHVNYWYFKGLEIKNTPQTSSAYGGQGFMVYGGGNNITVEQCVSHNNEGPGFGTRAVTNVSFLNCDAYANYDPYTSSKPGDSADGFDIGFQTGGVVTCDGCRAWNNSDDGFDLYQGSGNYGTYYLSNCWADHQGYRTDQVTIGGDGNGFKLGDDGQAYNSAIVQRYITNCISTRNKQCGFSQQAADVRMVLQHNIAYANLTYGFEFLTYNCADLLQNNISYSNGNADYFQSLQTRDHNSWNGHTVTNADFASMTIAQLLNPRVNGNLPVMTFLHLVGTSSLVHTGVTTSVTTDCDRVAYATPTPSIGPFEYSAGGAVAPTVTTTAVTSITTTTAASGGNVTADGGASVTARGVCWSTSANPTTANTKTTNGTGTGTFTSSLTGLTSNTLYHVRAYATNSVSTSYGADVQFTTATAVVSPTVTTTDISGITDKTAVSGGTITSNGGGTITAAGVCWATTTSPTTANSKTNNSNGATPYISTLTGLTPLTTYYVRAYATNSAGTAYGAQVSFITTATPVPREIHRVRWAGKLVITR
jgi:hypothetical protein